MVDDRGQPRVANDNDPVSNLHPTNIPGILFRG